MLGTAAEATQSSAQDINKASNAAAFAIINVQYLYDIETQETVHYWSIE